MTGGYASTGLARAEALRLDADELVRAIALLIELALQPAEQQDE